MTQLGEGVAIGLLSPGPKPKQGPGNLQVTVTESSREEAVEGVKLTLSGPASASATTDAAGQCRFDGIAAGSYRITLAQDEFEMTPSQTKTAVEGDQTRLLPLRVKRVLATVVVKRIHMQGLLKAAIGDKSRLEYGHWWVEIDDAESYGWWPDGPVSMGGTLGGIPGVLNVFKGSPGTPTRDPHHGDPGDEEFSPRVLNGKSATANKQALRAFAAGFAAGFAVKYGSIWRWPQKYNCHSFQEQMMSATGMSRNGSKKLQ